MTHIEQQRIIALIEKDDLDAALEQIDAMEEALGDGIGESPDPTHVVDLLTLRATVHMRNDDHERALSVINDMVELQPGNPVTLLMMGATLAELDRFDEARRVFDVVERLADDPWATEARNALITLAEADAAASADAAVSSPADVDAAEFRRGVDVGVCRRLAEDALSIVCAEGLDSFVLPLRGLLEERYDVRVYTVGEQTRPCRSAGVGRCLLVRVVRRHACSSQYKHGKDVQGHLPNTRSRGVYGCAHERQLGLRGSHRFRGRSCPRDF